MRACFSGAGEDTLGRVTSGLIRTFFRVCFSAEITTTIMFNVEGLCQCHVFVCEINYTYTINHYTVILVSVLVSTEIFTKLAKKWKKNEKFKKRKNNFLDIIERYNLAKIHVPSTYSCLSLLQNMFLRKSHFCEKGHFLT